MEPITLEFISNSSQEPKAFLGNQSCGHTTLGILVIEKVMYVERHLQILDGVSCTQIDNQSGRVVLLDGNIFA